MRNRRYLAHVCCIGSSVFRRYVTEVTPGSVLDAFFPFTGEISHTAFYDGILLFTAPGFPPDAFLCRLKEDMSRYPDLTFPELLLKNPVYMENPAVRGKECRVRLLAPVDWKAYRPESGSVLTVV